MRYLSLFSGVGGFELGIQRAFDKGRLTGAPEMADNSSEPTGSNGLGGWTHSHNLGNQSAAEIKQVGQGRDRNIDQSRGNVYDRSDAPLCVGYSEIDKYAIETYEKNWKGHTNYGDATTINERRLPDFELLVGGFPCQSFSIAGKRAGFNDTRGTLFFDIARILKHKRPGHLVLENVKGLLSHDGGKTFQTIVGVLTDLGYDVEWQVLNAKNFGVPQNRERIFIVGHLRGGCTGKILPLRSDNQKAAFGTIHRSYHKGQHTGSYIATKKAPKIIHNIYGGFKEKKARVFDIAPTIRTSKGGGHLPSLLHDSKIRRLTPVECERLMSWPDGWTVGSDTQRYKQCGNGVVSNCVQAVIEALDIA